jgi:hypothetical protein
MGRKGGGMKQTTRLLGTLAIAGTGLFLLISLFKTNAMQQKTTPSQAPIKSTSAEVPEATKLRLQAAYGKLPLHFEANQGQAASQVEFLSRSSGYTLFLTSTEAVLALRRPQEETSAVSRELALPPEQPEMITTAVLRMQLVGASPSPVVRGLDKLPGKSNYFIGNDPTKWRTNVPNYAKVRYEAVYPGIDLIYYGNQRQLEYDFVVAPGADPDAIRLGFQGADKLSLGADGNLVLHTASGEVIQRVPLVYQEINGARQELSGRYVLTGKERVGFQVAKYDTSRPLVIDPVLVLNYSTYLGGYEKDAGGSIAVDATGNAYVAGFTNSNNFPTAPDPCGGVDPPCPFQATFSGGSFDDAFVTKLNAAGTDLVYSTYLGGSGGREEGHGIAVDDAGNAYVTGVTRSTDFPTTLGAFQTVLGGLDGLDDAFVTKLNADGSALLYSTYLGGSGGDFGTDIAVDDAGNAYVTGQTNFTAAGDFPTTPGAFQTVYGGGSDDAFVTKLNPAGTGVSDLVYSTYIGGSLNEVGFGIAVDAAGKAYVTGLTRSADDPDAPGTPGDEGFPTTTGAYQTVFGGTWDAFVTKLNGDGSALLYSTYLGGIEQDVGMSIAVEAGNAYVTGRTDSADDDSTPSVDEGFPITIGAFQSDLGGFRDAFVTKLNAAGTDLVYSTYLGGSLGGSVSPSFPNGTATDTGMGIVVDSVGNAYVIGFTQSTNFPTESAIQAAFGLGSNDAFVTKLNAAGSALVYSTYLGGNGGDSGRDIAVDADGDAYVTGVTGYPDSITTFPTTAWAFQPDNAFGLDAFVAKIGPLGPTPTVDIDIKPGSDPNSIYLCSNGVVPVAIFGTGDFDVNDINVEEVVAQNLELAGSGVAIRGRANYLYSIEDLDGDGIDDMIVHFEVETLSLTAESGEAILKGELMDGTLFEGRDSINIVQDGCPN